MLLKLRLEDEDEAPVRAACTGLPDVTDEDETIGRPPVAFTDTADVDGMSQQT